MLIFSQVKASDIPDIASVTPDSPQFALYVNKAVRMLMTRGNWWSTVVGMRGCITDNCIVWNRHVGTVIALNVCGQPMQMANHWYQFLPRDVFPSWNGSAFLGPEWTGGMVGNMTVAANGTSPVFNPIACAQGLALRFFIEKVTDVGKKITIYGTDSNGQTVRSNFGGFWQDGVQLQFAVPYVDTPILFRHVDRVVKEETDGPVRGYQVDTVNNVLLDLAFYEATETTPQYVCSRVVGCQGTTCQTKQITALVKLQFIPVKHDNDLVQIDNLDALKFAVQGIRLEEANQDEAAKGKWIRAIDELNAQDRDKIPDRSIVVRSNPVGRTIMSPI